MILLEPFNEIYSLHGVESFKNKVVKIEIMYGNIFTKLYLMFLYCMNKFVSIQNKQDFLNLYSYLLIPIFKFMFLCLFI